MSKPGLAYLGEEPIHQRGMCSLKVELGGSNVADLCLNALFFDHCYPVFTAHGEIARGEAEDQAFDPLRVILGKCLTQGTPKSAY